MLLGTFSGRFEITIALFIFFLYPANEVKQRFACLRIRSINLFRGRVTPAEARKALDIRTFACSL